MAVPTDIADVVTIPWPTTNDPPDELVMQRLLISISRRIGEMATDWSAYDGQLLAVASDGSGPRPLADSGLAAVDLAGIGVKGNAIAPVTVTGSGLLTWNAHLGQEVVYAGSGAATLTINLDSTGQLGVKSGFQCLVMRAFDGNSVGALSFALGAGLTSQRADGKTGVGPGGLVSVRVVGTRVWLSGNVI